jgi:hypothetical protein
MSKLAIGACRFFAAAFRYACIIMVVSLLPSCIWAGKTDTDQGPANTIVVKRDSSKRQVASKPDTSKKQMYVPPEINEDAVQKAVISKVDSSFNVYNNIRADYRIVGYELPDTNSRKMVLFSVFTTDVKDNPFNCPYGSYYDSAQGDKLVIKHTGKRGAFIEAKISGENKEPAVVYFQEKWVEFDD